MGQQLNFEITNADGEPLATGYYHWSGYLDSAVNLAVKMARFLKAPDCDNWDELTETDRAILVLMATGAKVQEDDYRAYATTDPGRKTTLQFSTFATDRNEGLISFNPKGMAKTQGLAEAVVVLYLETQEFDFSGFLWKHDSIEDVANDHCIENIETAEEVKDFAQQITVLPSHLDLESVRVDCVEELKGYVEDSRKKTRCFKVGNADVYYSFGS